MPGLFERLLLTASQRPVAALARAVRVPAGDSFILDWSLDGTDADDAADDDTANELLSSVK